MSFAQHDLPLGRPFGSSLHQVSTGRYRQVLERKKTYSALDGNDTSRAKVKISRVQSQPVWYFAPRLLDSLRRLVGPFDQIPKIAGRGEARPGRARGPWPDIRKGRLGDGRVGELDCRVVQQDTAWPGRRGRGGHEVELGGGLGAGQEGEGGEQAGEVVWRLGSGCGLLEPGDGSSDAEEDGAEAFWALEYVGGVWMADVPVLETGGLHEEAEGAVGGGHGGGRKWRAAKRCQQIPRPRLLFLFSSSRTSPYTCIILFSSPLARHTTRITPLLHAMPATRHTPSPAPPQPAAEHPADPAAPPSDQRAKKKRLGVDPSLIIAEGGRSKRRRTPSPQPEQQEHVDPDPRDSARAKELGMVIYERIMGSKTKE